MRSHLRAAIYAMIASFAAVFAIGLLPGPTRLFLVPLLCFGMASLVLLSLALRSQTPSRVRRRLLGTSISAAAFTTGLLYGTFGMMGSYEINDPIYLTLVVGSALGTVVGLALSLVSLRTDVVGVIE